MCSQLGLLCFHVQFCLGMKLQMVINPLHFPSLPFEVNSRQPSAFYVNPSWRWLACSEQSSTMPLELKIATSYQHKTAMNFLQHPTFRTNLHRSTSTDRLDASAHIMIASDLDQTMVPKPFLLMIYTNSRAIPYYVLYGWPEDIPPRKNVSAILWEENRQLFVCKRTKDIHTWSTL
jgi:hypothetical protein